MSILHEPPERLGPAVAPGTPVGSLFVRRAIEPGSEAPAARPLSERKRHRVRRRLAVAAVRLFETRGYAATTVEEIADAADCSPRTFFRYVAAKDDVIFYDTPDRLDDLRAALADVPGGPVWPVLRDGLLHHARDLMAGAPEFELARARLFVREPVLGTRFLAICLEWEDAIATALAGERDVDPATDPYCRLVAGAVVAAVRSAYQALAAEGGDLAALVEERLVLLESGLRLGPRRRPTRTRPAATG